MLESCDKPQQSQPPVQNGSTIEERPPGCATHLERTGIYVPAYRLGLCRACFRGRSIFPSERLGEKQALHRRASPSVSAPGNGPDTTENATQDAVASRGE